MLISRRWCHFSPIGRTESSELWIRAVRLWEPRLSSSPPLYNLLLSTLDCFFFLGSQRGYFLTPYLLIDVKLPILLSTTSYLPSQQWQSKASLRKTARNSIKPIIGNHWLPNLLTNSQHSGVQKHHRFRTTLCLWFLGHLVRPLQGYIASLWEIRRRRRIPGGVLLQGGRRRRRTDRSGSGDKGNADICAVQERGEDIWFLWCASGEVGGPDQRGKVSCLGSIVDFDWWWEHCN